MTQSVLLAFGANLGDRRKTLNEAWCALGQTKHIETIRLSSYYETEPVGGPAGQPQYLNAAGIIQTTLPPEELLNVLQKIETRFGRVRSEHWGARTLDIDILLFGCSPHGTPIVALPNLVIPHAEMLHRQFVLVPANDIAADWIHPMTQKTIGEHLRELRQQEFAKQCQPRKIQPCKLMQVLFLFLLFYAAALSAAEEPLQLVQSLANRGQFAAAEAFCQEQFARTDLGDIDKIQLATELVRSRSMQLLIIEPARREQFVKRLQELENNWLSGSKTGGLTPLALTNSSSALELAFAKMTLRLQLAMAESSFGNDQRLEADAAPVSQQQRAYQQARITLQNAVDRLKSCQQELQAFRQQIGINADALLRQKISALESSITMQQGIVQKSLALTFSADAERNFELRRAAEMFSPLASLNSDDPAFMQYIVQCKIAKASCHRLCGEQEQCREILLPLLTLPDAENRLRAEAEWIRLLIAEKHIAQARQQFAAEPPEAGRVPDFNLARLELFLASDPERNIRPDHVSAVRLQETMERELGAYWGRRARMTVSIFSGNDTELVSAEMLRTLADNQFREGRFAESAELYEQAAAKADTNRQAESMFQNRRLAIAAWSKALEQLPEDSPKTGYQSRLLSLLRNVSVQNPNHPEAVQLHLSAIDIQRQRTAEQPETINDYMTLVKEHLAIWQESPQLQQLRRLLVILLERQGFLDEASALLPLLDAEQLETLTPEIQRLRVRQLDAEGKTQEAVDLLSALLKQKREPATMQLLAEILSRQSDEKSLQYALGFWMQLERSLPKNTETWWAVREGMIEVLCKLDRRAEAEKSFLMLQTLYPALGGAERKERLTKRFDGK